MAGGESKEQKIKTDGVRMAERGSMTWTNTIKDVKKLSPPSLILLSKI